MNLGQRFVCCRDPLIAQLVKDLPVMQKTLLGFLSQKDLLEKG